MKYRTLIGFFLVCVVVCTLPLQAQNPRVGTQAAPELIIPVGARDFAMSGSSLATSKGLEAIYWNPAGLTKMTGSAEAMFSSMSYIADINSVYGAVGGSFGNFGTVAFSVRSIGFGEINLTTDEDPEGLLGRFYSPSYVTVGGTFARNLTDNVSVGATVKVISEQIDRVSASGFAFDIGVQYRNLVSVSGLSLGLAIKNIGPGMTFSGPGLYRRAIVQEGSRLPTQNYTMEAATFELPAQVDIGLAYDLRLGDNMTLSTNGAYSNDNLYYDEYRAGAELGFLLDEIQLFGRAGFVGIPQVTEQEYGETFGFGVGYATGGVHLQFDFAYRSALYFSGNQVISLKVGF